MLISIALLGFGAVGKEVYKKLKLVDGFGEDFRIHIVQVQDVSNYNPVIINSKGWMVIDDENSEDEGKRVTIGDDLEWLVESDGHDTVIDCTPYSEKSKDLVLTLLKRGYWLHTCSKELVSKHWNELLDVCDSNNRSKINFNSIAASSDLEKFKGVDLTESNLKDYKDEDLYSFRGAGPEETAEYIVRDIVAELKERRVRYGKPR
jgi:homoserine dehydrogenase